MYNGIVNVYKPSGMTSFDVIAKMRRIFGQKKIGHTGTLDPMAKGVLVTVLGSATCLADTIVSKEKEYEAELTLGIKTDTDDITGERVDDVALASENEKCFLADREKAEESVRRTILSFVKKYDQIPPKYSAIKINGKKLYEYARAGVEIEIPAREVEIYSIDILSMDLPKVRFLVRCTKGTYIRSLCRDIGEELGLGGTMSDLIRRRVQNFTDENAFTLEKLEELKEIGQLEDTILPTDSLVSCYERADILPEFEKYLLNGNKLSKDMFEIKKNGTEKKECDIIRLYDCSNKLHALYRYDAKDKVYRNYKTL